MPTARRSMNCGSSSVRIRARARQGFTPSETAFAIFALRDGVLDTLDHAGHVEYGDSVAFSKLVDGLTASAKRLRISMGFAIGFSDTLVHRVFSMTSRS